MMDYIKCYVEFETTAENAGKLSGYEKPETDGVNALVDINFQGVPFPTVPRKGENITIYPDAVAGGGQRDEVTIFGVVADVRYQVTMFKEGGSSCSTWVELDEVYFK